MFAESEEPAQAISLEDVNKVCLKWVHRGVLKAIHDPVEKQTCYQNVDYYYPSNQTGSENQVETNTDNSQCLYVKSNGPKAESINAFAAVKPQGNMSERHKLLKTYILNILRFRTQAPGQLGMPQVSSSSQPHGKSVSNIFGLLST